MSLREKFRKYFEKEGEEMWTDYNIHIDELFGMIEKGIDERFQHFAKEDTSLAVFSGYEMAVKDFKDMLK